MITVIQIKQSGASPRRRTVLFDGPNDPFITSRVALDMANIAAGSSFSSFDEFRTSLSAVEHDAAMQRALDVISRREVSRRILERKLSDDGYSSEIVNQIVERVLELGYLDDARFAKAVWRTETSAGYGPGRAVQKLRAAGVESELVEATRLECQGEGSLPDPLESARALAVRWGAPFADRTARQKAVRKLVSRGFSLEIAIRACDGTELDADLG